MTELQKFHKLEGEIDLPTQEIQTIELKTHREEPGKIVFRAIKLNPGISTLNFVSSQLHYMFMVFSFSAGDSLQPLILLDRDYYNLDRTRSGTILSYILTSQLVLKVLTAIIYGHLNDKFGRRSMLVYGATSMLAGYMLAPTFQNVFPGFIIAKMLSSNGSTALSTLPFIADYIHNDSKGKATALGVALSTVGAFLANIFIKILLYCKVPLGYCYWIIGFVAFAAMVLNSFGLKSGHYFLEGKTSEKVEHKQSFKQNLYEAVQEYKSNGWLSICLILQILGNADFYIVSTILALYIKSLFPPGTDDRISNIALNNMQSFVFAPAFVSNFIYGYSLDKYNKVIQSITVALAGGIFSFLLIFFVHSPYNWKLYVACSVLGTTITGIYVIANYLGSKYFSSNKRGIMNGIQALIGYVGYVIIASLGGFLFDHWTHNAPFILYTILMSLALVFITCIYFKKIKK